MRIALLGCLVLATSACASSGTVAADAMPAVSGPEVQLNGIRYIQLTEGRGASAERNHCIYAHYTAYRTVGRRVESSRDPLPNGLPQPPVAFVMGRGQVMRGWEIGFAGMRVGEARRLFVPAEFAYGAKGNPPRIPPDAPLIFDVELVGVGDAAAGGNVCPAWKPA